MAKAARGQNDVPIGRHWAIITFGTMLIPGDERSRSNPGHGYPESTVITTDYTVYSTEEWLTEINRTEAVRSYYKRDYTALVAERPVISATVEVKVALS